MLADLYRMLINGELVNGELSMDVIDPSTGRSFAQSPRASHAQLNHAVDAAVAAYPAWSGGPIERRRAALGHLADAVQAKAPELAPILVREHGMPIGNAMMELMVFALKLRGASMQPVPVKRLEVGGGRTVEQHYRPLGVVAAIVPWNVPLILLAAKLGPALLMGNTVVVKPAPTTPLTTLLIGEIIAGLVPPGVVNVIADDNDLGALLATHPQVRMIAFTGSTATGKKVMASAAGTIKRLTLELGGNDPAIVFDDADVKDAAKKIFAQAFLVSGQACIAIKRVYAQGGIHDQLCSELAALAATAKVGNGFEPEVTYGPLQNKAQFDRVNDLLREAKVKGRIVGQGSIPSGDGYFVPPTIVADLTDGDRLVDEEQFGPILPVIRFHDADALVSTINAGPYGLAASVFTSDPVKGQRIAAQIDAGTVTVNKVLEMHPFVPFGGAKQSGIGVENGEEGLAEFSQRQIIDTASAP